MFGSFAHQHKLSQTFVSFRKQSISKFSRLININKICYFCGFLRKGNTSLQAILLGHVLKNKNRKRFLQWDFEEKCCFLQKSEKVAKKWQKLKFTLDSEQKIVIFGLSSGILGKSFCAKKSVFGLRVLSSLARETKFAKSFTGRNFTLCTNRPPF